jgi:bifunctional non-homologous end joining protein LigD
MGPIFVVHEHHAKNLHFDFRLEMEGVLRSWAIPKGPSMDPAEKRLAVEVEDHPLEYADFEGIIPQGQYGAGPVVIWDKGHYELVEAEEDRISVKLHGRKLKGAFVLVRLKSKGPRAQWLLMKRKDGEAQPGWKLSLELTPERLEALEERIPPCAME